VRARYVRSKQNETVEETTKKQPKARYGNEAVFV
jgi:hypothetical protein